MKFNKENMFQKAEEFMDIILMPEKVMSKLILSLTVIDLAAIGIFGGKYALTGIALTILISAIFFAVKRTNRDNSRSLPVLIVSSVALFKTLALEVHISQFSSNFWLEVISTIAFCTAGIMLVCALNSYTCVTDEDIREEIRRESLIR